MNRSAATPSEERRSIVSPENERRDKWPSMNWNRNEMGCVIDRKYKKHVTYGLIAVFYLLGGIEYGIVLPSLWPFLQNRFNVGDSGDFYGLTLSALAATSFLASPFFGAIVDRLPSAKPLLIFGCIASALGNALYFTALNKWFLFFGRVLCGAGWACRPALLADITRTTTPEERTGILTIIMAFPQIGHFLGPAVNVVLVRFDFWLFDFIHIDKYTACGFFSCIMFLLELIVGSLFYFNLQEIRDMELASHDYHALKDRYFDKSCSILEEKLREIETEEEEDEEEIKEEDKTRKIPSPSPSPSPSLWSRIDSEIVVSLSLVFVSNFGLSTLETIAFPIMDFLFGWNIILNSLFSSIACALIIGSLFGLHFVSKRATDRGILLGLQLIGFFSIIWMLISNVLAMGSSDYIINEATDQEVTFWRAMIILGYCFFCVSIPTISVIAVSLLSKMFKRERQGIGQGAQLNVTSLANILAPLWTGSMVWKSLSLMFGVELCLHLIVFVLFICSWKKLNPGKEDEEREKLIK